VQAILDSLDEWTVAYNFKYFDVLLCKKDKIKTKNMSSVHLSTSFLTKILDGHQLNFAQETYTKSCPVDLMLFHVDLI
jgi:hypothetical protein